MLTIVFTYRDRDIQIVKKSLDSLKNQTITDFKVVFVNYGSSDSYNYSIKKLCKSYSFVSYIECPVQGQLWNKSRAINIALKTTKTPYFMVGDVDIIYRNDFIEFINNNMNGSSFLYFKAGFLSQQESLKSKSFNDYNIDYYSNHEGTGWTVFPTNALNAIKGADEFYHGWGAEDTDMHVRLGFYGVKSVYIKEPIFLLHQWHPKAYRTTQSRAPYHSLLERINHEHLKLTKQLKITKANTNCDWGVLPQESDYKALINTPCKSITLYNSKLQVDAFFQGTLPKLSGVIYVEFTIKQEGFKNKIKRTLGKKYIPYYTKQDLSNKLLEAIMLNYRNQPYHFQSFSNRIELTIKL